MKSSGKVFALKVLNKWEMLKRHQVSLKWVENSYVEWTVVILVVKGSIIMLERES